MDGCEQLQSKQRTACKGGLVFGSGILRIIIEMLTIACLRHSMNSISHSGEHNPSMTRSNFRTQSLVLVLFLALFASAQPALAWGYDHEYRHDNDDRDRNP